MNSITLTRPDDWHLHLRDDDALAAVAQASARQMGRAIIMPNLTPPVTHTAQALAYRERILAALPATTCFEPLMTLYLTDHTTAEDIEQAYHSGFVRAVKLYPAGATTNSDSGVTDITLCDAAIAAMARLGMPLLVHGEVTDAEIDIFDREAVFIERVLKPLLDRHSGLRVVFEHITTADAVRFVAEEAPATVAATITAHHLLYNRNQMLVGGIRPHYYCLPILKRESHRQALLEAAAGGSAKFFLGTDSAPHSQSAKENACGCAGAYTAPAAIELYATAFDSIGAIDRLENFASHAGPDFYGIPRNSDTITLERKPWTMPVSLPYVGSERIVPLCAGEQMEWAVKE